jgi:hypothetical protein
MNFGEPYITPGGSGKFSITPDGTCVRLSFGMAKPLEITGVQAKELRTWLQSQTLRSSAEARESTIGTQDRQTARDELRA